MKDAGGPQMKGKGKRELTPHQRIMRAANRGTGLRLSADTVFELSQDGAIATCAANDDDAQEVERQPKKGKRP